MKLTRHSIDRGEERLNLSVQAFARTARTALTLGLKHSQTRGKLKRYIDALYFQERAATNIRIYGEHVYLFTGETLITVLHLPNEFKSLVNKIRSKERAK